MFDPYHKWLGIRPKDQPPNHYRLLGLDLFESDAEVIDAAANRQMAYLQQRATGEHAAQSQKLLNEISAARLCLLNPKRKAEYDTKLKEHLGGTGASGKTTEPDLLADELLAAPEPTVAKTKASPSSLRERPRLELWHFAVAAGGIVLVVLGCLWFFLPSASRDSATYSDDNNLVENVESQGSITANQDEAEAATEQPERDVVVETTTPPQTGPPESRLSANPTTLPSIPSAKTVPPAHKAIDEPSSRISGEWVSLCDGNSLEGWNADRNKRAWSVVNGSVVGDTPDGYGQAGTLYSESSFSDFEFIADVKIRNGHAGFYFRAAQNRPDPLGYKVLIVANDVRERGRT